MKKILALLNGLTIMAPLSINLYSCNNPEKEDPKVSQQKLDDLVDLFNYYNSHNDNPYNMLWFELNPNQRELFTKYKKLQLDKVYKLSLSQILLNSIFSLLEIVLMCTYLWLMKMGDIIEKKLKNN